MTPQSPKEALPGKFPPRLRVKIGNENYYDHYGASEIVFEQHVDIWGHRFDDWPKYLSLSEHESALAEAVRKARAGAFEEAASALGEAARAARDIGMSDYQDAYRIGRKRMIEKYHEALSGAAALSAPGEEGERDAAEAFAEKESRASMERLIGYLGEDECDRERLELDRRTNKAYLKLGYVNGLEDKENRIEGLTSMNKHWVQQLKLCEEENQNLRSQLGAIKERSCEYCKGTGAESALSAPGEEGERNGKE